MVSASICNKKWQVSKLCKSCWVTFFFLNISFNIWVSCCNMLPNDMWVSITTVFQKWKLFFQYVCFIHLFFEINLSIIDTFPIGLTKSFRSCYIYLRFLMVFYWSYWHFMKLWKPSWIFYVRSFTVITFDYNLL